MTARRVAGGPVNEVQNQAVIVRHGEVICCIHSAMGIGEPTLAEGFAPAKFNATIGLLGVAVDVLRQGHRSAVRRSDFHRSDPRYQVRPWLLSNHHPTAREPRVVAAQRSPSMADPVRARRVSSRANTAKGSTIANLVASA